MDSENSSVEKRSGSADLTDVHGPEKRRLDVDTTNVDVAAGLTAGKDFVLDPAAAARVRYVPCAHACEQCGGRARW